MRHHRKFRHFELMIIGRNEAAEGQAINPVQNLRRIVSRPILQDITVGMLLGQVFVIGQRPLGLDKLLRQQSDLFIGWYFFKIRWQVVTDKGRARNASERTALTQPTRHLYHLQFTRAVDQQIRPRIEKDRAADSVFPVIIVSQTAE